MDDTRRPRLAARALWLCALLALIAASVLGVALPADQVTAAQPTGGGNFKLTSNGGGSVTLSWATGSGQTGYRLNRITASGTVVVATPASTATSFTDTLASTVAVACYQLEILNGTATIGRSDILCVIVNVAGGPSPVRNVAIQTNESPAVLVSWQAPTAGTVIGYLVVPLGRTPLSLVPAGTLQAVDSPVSPVTCYIVLTLVPDSAQVPFKVGGFSDIVCAFVNTFSPQPVPTLTPTRTNTPVNTNTSVATNTNTVLTSTATNTNTPGPSSTPTITLTPSNSLLTILKTDSPDPVNVGENLVYTITITNNNPSNTGPVVFADNLPAGVTFSSATGTQGFACFFTSQNNSVGCTVNNLASGATATITISVFVDNPCFVISPITNVARVALGGSITNTSPSFVASTTVNGCTQATGTSTSTRTPTSTATVTNTPVNTATPAVDLQINKFDVPDPIPAAVGGGLGNTPVSLQYTLQVNNTGNVSASGITVVDTLPTQGAPATWTFGSAAGDAGFICTFDPPNIVNCTGGTIGANGGATITITLNVYDCGSFGSVLLNSVVVDPANVIPELNENNNSAFSQTACGAGANTPTILPTGTRTPTPTRTVTTTVTTLPTQSASFLKTASVGAANVGQSFDYTLTFTNSSGSTISGIQINDALPPEVTFLGVTANSGFDCSHIGGDPGGTVICDSGSVASGSTGVITISVAVTTCTSPLVNTATVLNPPMTNPASTTTTTVNGCNTVTPTATRTSTVTLTPTNTATFTPTITVTPPTFDIGPITKAPAAGSAATGTQVNYVISIPVGAGTGATWGPTQVSVRDTWSGFTRTGATAILFSGWTTNPTCSQVGAQINCVGGSIPGGTTATVTIPLIVNACGVNVNTTDVDPDNAIAELNEANNTATATNTNVCDSAITKSVNVGSVNTAGGAQNVTYTLTINDVAAGQTVVAPSTVTDTLPAGIVPTAASVTSGTGSCGIVGQVVTCTGVGGAEPVTIDITGNVPITTTAGNKNNTATVTTPGDSNAGNNVSNVSTVSVFNFNVSVNVTDNPDPVTSGPTPFSYQITVTNTSAGGFAAPNPFFVNGGLMVRTNPCTPGSFPGCRVGDADAFATLTSVTSASPGVTCVFPATGVSNLPDNQRYSCSIAGLAAGASVTVSANAFALAAESTAGQDVSLDANLTKTNPITCVGGGLDTTCAPESTFVATNPAPAGTLSNNYTKEFTDID